MKEVENVVLKLLDANIIDPIAGSKWINPIQVRNRGLLQLKMLIEYMSQLK